jgi:glycosyltransferase involved in cell wall biosynthesis
MQQFKRCAGLRSAYDGNPLSSEDLTVNSPPSSTQDMTPTVSVVIPTFNRSSLLLNAIESVFAQTYAAYELIVVDDGSTDDTRDRLRPLMDRIRYVYQPNRGAAAAQNKGIGVAKGEWVSILASDDLWMPAKLESQLKALKTLSDEFGACFTDCILVGHPERHTSLFERAGLRTESEFGELLDPFRYIVGEYTAICFQSLLVKRSLLNEVGGFDEALGVGEDTELISRLIPKTKFCFLSAPLVRIDATPTVGRLTDLIGRKNDQVCAWYEYRYRKWLNLREIDGGNRQTVYNALRALYYGWAISKLNDLDFAGGLQKISEIKRLGDSYRTILLTLLSRAVGKVFRTLRGRPA